MQFLFWSSLTTWSVLFNLISNEGEIFVLFIIDWLKVFDCGVSFFLHNFIENIWINYIFLFSNNFWESFKFWYWSARSTFLIERVITRELYSACCSVPPYINLFILSFWHYILLANHMHSSFHSCTFYYILVVRK